MNTKFILVQASDPIYVNCLFEASEWIGNPNQKRYTNVSGHADVVYVVAEYLLNKRGFTMHEMNASWPKEGRT